MSEVWEEGLVDEFRWTRLDSVVGRSSSDLTAEQRSGYTQANPSLVGSRTLNGRDPPRLITSRRGSLHLLLDRRRVPPPSQHPNPLLARPSYPIPLIQHRFSPAALHQSRRLFGLPPNLRPEPLDDPPPPPPSPRRTQAQTRTTLPSSTSFPIPHRPLPPNPTLSNLFLRRPTSPSVKTRPSHGSELERRENIGFSGAKRMRLRGRRWRSFGRSRRGMSREEEDFDVVVFGSVFLSLLFCERDCDSRSSRP